MFAEYLNVEEKVGLINLLTNIAKADGDVSEDEIQFLKSFADELNIEINIENHIDLVAACSMFKSSKSKLIAIQELIKLALIDGQYDISEKQGIVVISNLLEIPNDIFEQMERWVIAGYEWMHEGEFLLNSEF